MSSLPRYNNGPWNQGLVCGARYGGVLMSEKDMNKQIFALFAAISFASFPEAPGFADVVKTVPLTSSTVSTGDHKVTITYVDKDSKLADRLVELRTNGDFVVNVVKDADNESEQIGKGMRLVSLALAQDKGIAEKKAGDYIAAQRDFSYAVEEARELRSDTVLAETLRSLASVSRLLKEREEALASYREALDLIDKTDGTQSVPAASIIDDMARVYDELNNPEEGEKLHKKALAIFEKTQGANGPDVVICLYNLSDCYLKTDRFDDAETALLKALKVLEARGEGNTIDYATTMDNLGGVYSDGQNFADAEKTHRKALEIFAKTAGPQSIDTGICYQNLANVLMQEKKFAEAKENYNKALAIETQIRGADHPRVKTLKAKLSAASDKTTATTSDK